VNTRDLVAAPFRSAAAIRHGRVFHPDGVLATGSIERVAPQGEGLPVNSSADVVARISKGIGTPGALPDIIGLAIRLPPQPLAETPWDILLASAGSGVLSRAAGLRPAVGWSGRTLSTLMALRYDERNWWLRARMTTQVNGSGLSLDSVLNQLRCGGIDFDIDQACGAARFRPLARLTVGEVTAPDKSHEVAFDPVLHTATGIRLVPEWLASLRAQAYDRSRQGRHAA
jgi:hypothetical protein